MWAVVAIVSIAPLALRFGAVSKFRFHLVHVQGYCDCGLLVAIVSIVPRHGVFSLMLKDGVLKLSFVAQDVKLIIMFSRPRGTSAPWRRSRSRTPSAQLMAPVAPVPSADAKRSVQTLQFEGADIPCELVDSFQLVLETMQGLHRPRAPLALHSVLKHTWVPTARSLDGPTPRQNLNLLREHSARGGDMSAALNEVMRGRMGNVLAEGSCATYASHIRLVLRFCLTLGVKPLPAERSTVLRFIGLFNNARTLRGAVALLGGHRQCRLSCMLSAKGGAGWMLQPSLPYLMSLSSGCPVSCCAKVGLLSGCATTRQSTMDLLAGSTATGL